MFAFRLGIESAAIKWLADISDGDARTALSNLQLILSYFDKNSSKIVTVEDIEDKLKVSQENSTFQHGSQLTTSFRYRGPIFYMTKLEKNTIT